MLIPAPSRSLARAAAAVAQGSSRSSTREAAYGAPRRETGPAPAVAGRQERRGKPGRSGAGAPAAARSRAGRGGSPRRVHRPRGQGQTRFAPAPWCRARCRRHGFRPGRCGLSARGRADSGEQAAGRGSQPASAHVARWSSQRISPQRAPTDPSEPPRKRSRAATGARAARVEPREAEEARRRQRDARNLQRLARGARLRCDGWLAGAAVLLGEDGGDPARGLAYLRQKAARQKQEPAQAAKPLERFRALLLSPAEARRRAARASAAVRREAIAVAADVDTAAWVCRVNRCEKLAPSAAAILRQHAVARAAAAASAAVPLPPPPSRSASSARRWFCRWRKRWGVRRGRLAPGRGLGAAAKMERAVLPSETRGAKARAARKARRRSAESRPG